MSEQKRRATDKEDTQADSFKLIDHPFYLFGLIVLNRVREVNRALSPFNFDHQKWRVAAILNDHPDCTMQALAERTGVDRTTLAHTVQLMIDAKLVTKTVRAADRRSVGLSLTDKGKKTLQAIFPTMMEINKRGFSDFSPKELTLFMGQLRRILTNLQDGALPRLAHDATKASKKPRLQEAFTISKDKEIVRQRRKAS